MTQNYFGTRFNDAHLSKTDFPTETNQLILDWIKRDLDILFFSGNPGCGKTHLCSAVLNFWKEQRKNVRAITEKDFLCTLRSAINQGWDYHAEVKRLCEADYFILDDLGSSSMSDWQKEVIFDLIDDRYSSRKPTLITSNLFRDDLKKIFDPRVLSRLYSTQNVIIDLHWKDRRQEAQEPIKS